MTISLKAKPSSLGELRQGEPHEEGKTYIPHREGCRYQGHEALCLVLAEVAAAKR
jgi:hypothetical protein